MKNKPFFLIFVAVILFVSPSYAQQSHKAIIKNDSNFKIYYDSCTVILDTTIPDRKKWIAILSYDNYFIRYFQRTKAESKFTIIISAFDKGNYPPDLYEMKMYFLENAVTNNADSKALAADNYLVTIKKTAEGKQRIVQIAFIGKKL